MLWCLVSQRDNSKFEHKAEDESSFHTHTPPTVSLYLHICLHTLPDLMGQNCIFWRVPHWLPGKSSGKVSFPLLGTLT